MRASSLLALALLGTVLVGVRVAATQAPALNTAGECAVDDIIPNVLYLEEDDVMLTSECLGPDGEYPGLPRFQSMDCSTPDYTLGGTDYWILQEDGGGGSGADHTDKQLCPQAECDENGGCTGCDECVEGTCVNACLDGEICEDGSCVPDTDECGDSCDYECESCNPDGLGGWSCQYDIGSEYNPNCGNYDPCAGVTCNNPCESCAAGVCGSYCTDGWVCGEDTITCEDPDPCGGNCFPGCEDCVDFGNGVGHGCVASAGSDSTPGCPNYDPCVGVACGDNQSCENGNCVNNDPCAGVTCNNPCESCAAGVCGSYCTDGQVCDNDGASCVSADPCDTAGCAACQICNAGACFDNCGDGQQCDTGSGICVTVNSGDPCNGTCQGCDICQETGPPGTGTWGCVYDPALPGCE